MLGWGSAPHTSQLSRWGFCSCLLPPASRGSPGLPAEKPSLKWNHHPVGRHQLAFQDHPKSLNWASVQQQQQQQGRGQGGRRIMLIHIM